MTLLNSPAQAAKLGRAGRTAVLKHYSFDSMADEVKATYASASIVGKRRVVFNVGGNKYRLVAKVSYRTKVVFIRFIGTHDEYDEIDVTTV